MPADQPPSSQATIAHCPTCRVSLDHDHVTVDHVERLRELLIAVQESVDEVRDFLFAAGDWGDEESLT